MFMLGATISTSAQKTPSVALTKFTTSAICGECKERIEKALNYSKGVVYAELNMENKELTVKYKTKLLTEQKVKEIVTGLGYKAGDIERNLAAFKELPKCCQEPGFCKD